MRFRRIIVTLAAAVSLSLGLPLAAASAAPAAHSAAGVPVAARAAAASTAQTGGNPSISVLSPGAARGNILTGGAKPLITWNPLCQAGTRTTWVLLFEFPLPTRGVNHWCFGFTGTWRFPPLPSADYASYFCAGNNHGSIHVLWPRGPNGTSRTYSFGPGTTISWPFSNPAQLVSLTITGWSGNNTCLV
jgi:hypothetical protein